MSYACFAASVKQESPFKAYSQQSFNFDLQIDAATSSTASSTANMCCVVGSSGHLQKQHLRQHLLQQHQKQHSQQFGSSSSSLRVTWQLASWALVVAAVVAVLLAFTPLGYPVRDHHQSWRTTRSAQHTMAPTAAVIKCKVQQGSSSVSSLCDGNDSGLQQRISVWHTATSAGALTQHGSSVAVDDGSDNQTDDAAGSSWGLTYGHSHHRQQHRKLVRL